MNLRIKIYQLLVNRVPVIQRKYHRIRQQKKGCLGRIYAWFALIGMNIVYLFRRRKFSDAYYFPDASKKVPTDRSESSLSFRETPEKLAERLKQYDVISFDVFDTLIFRPFSAPTDLFFLVGEKLKYLDFERIRMEMEWAARKRAYQKNGSYEVTLSDIYEMLEEQAGIPKNMGMQIEIETESELCFGNPYMLEVFRHLADCGKEIICTSDMYLPSEVIKRMVEKCGFTEIRQYFISCEYKGSKSDGALYQWVKDKLGKEKKYIHVGDNPVSDVKNAQKNGFTAEFYQNVNIAGMPYRAEDMSIITGSMYRGIVNAAIHIGLHKFGKEYELGFIYGGIFVLGYCQWIHEYVKNHDIDKILFLARDGDILHQAYTMLYPEESGEGKTEYVYWSRLAATKMGAKYFKYDYFRRFLHHKVNQGYTLRQIFKSMELEDMLSKMCEELANFSEMFVKSGKMYGLNNRVLTNIRKETQISHDTKLTDRNVWLIKEYLLAHWDEVLSHYEEQLATGQVYYSNVLKGCKKVCAVDVGWAGSGAVSLNHIVKDIWNLDCEVIGLLAGTNSIYNAEPNMSESLLYSGQLVSYLFSQEHNRDLWKFHDAGKGHNLDWEFLLASPTKPFRGFGFTKGNSKDIGNIRLIFGKADDNQEAVLEMQKGIKDFVEEWKKRFFSIPETKERTVAGADAYAVVRLAVGGKLFRQIGEMTKETVNVN